MLLGTMVVVALLLLVVLGAPKMVGAIPTPQDNDMLIQATVTKTAAFDSAAFDMGAGFTPGGLGMPVAAVIDVSAADRANGDETYSFKLQESADGATGWADIGIASSVPVNGNAATLGMVLARGFVNKRYVRLSLATGGTTPSVTYKAWLNTLFRR